MKETFVVDTNVLLSDGNFLKKMKGDTIIIPMIVIAELDKYKTAPGDLGLNARMTIRYIEAASAAGNILRGVVTPEGVLLKIVKVKVIAGEKPDDTIVRTTKFVAAKKKRVTLISGDAHLRIKAATEGVTAVPCSKDIFSKEDGLFPGVETMDVDDTVIADVFTKGTVTLPNMQDFPVNGYVLLVGSNKMDPVIICHKGDGLLKKIPSAKNVWGIVPRNEEQTCAMDLLLNQEIPLVTLVGSAGSGKTLLALAAGLKAVCDDRTYSKVIIIKPPIPMGKDVGFLPGSLQEKMAAWAGPIMDSLEVLLTEKTKFTFQFLVEKGMLEISPPTFVRGRSFKNAYIIVDEGQSLTRHEAKTLVTRIGEGSKIVFTGDVHQIDNPKVSAEDNGLTDVVEAFKKYDVAGHVTLNKCERSSLAALAAQVL